MDIQFKFGIMIFMLLYLNTGNVEAEGCNVDDLAADVVVLLDTSGSIGRNNFPKIIHAVHKLVEYFKLGPQNLQIGTVTFSSNVRTEGLMNRYNSVGDPAIIKRNTLVLINYINTHYEGMGTNTAAALQFVMRKSFTATAGDRPGVPNILIVMTDGASDNKVATLREAAELHKRGIICVSVGIGVNRTLDFDELRQMASNDSYMYTVGDFDLLDSFVTTLKDVICTEGIMMSQVPNTTKKSTKDEYVIVGPDGYPIVG